MDLSTSDSADQFLKGRILLRKELPVINDGMWEGFGDLLRAQPYLRFKSKTPS